MPKSAAKCPPWLERLISGVCRPLLGKTSPFAKIADALRYLESNAQVGKIVVTV
jgi:NADPH:quinone reductase-like Zn-dependent oxidoreductase